VGAQFQVASADGSLAYYTAAGSLYRYRAQTQAVEEIASAVLGVLGASADGKSVYYQDSAGLWLWREGSVTALATGPDAAASSDFPPSTGTSRVTADGSKLAFLSQAPLIDADNTDAETGLPDTELYLFDLEASPPLICVSCNPTGERPRGSALIPGALINGTTTVYRPRVLSADGRRLFFESEDSLAAADTDSRPDVYQWERGGEGD
jgi:hypothetical protein